MAKRLQRINNCGWFIVNCDKINLDKTNLTWGCNFHSLQSSDVKKCLCSHDIWQERRNHVRSVNATWRPCRNIFYTLTTLAPTLDVNMLSYPLWNLCQCGGYHIARLFGYFLYQGSQTEDHNPIIAWALYKLLHVLCITRHHELKVWKSEFTCISVKSEIC